jgi:hypothetical protein
MDLVVLKNEIVNDPLARGYSQMNDEGVADSLNKPDRRPDRDALETGQLAASIVQAEYTALTVAQKDYLRMLTTQFVLPLTPAARAELRDMFPAGSATRANLVAILKRTGSRADELGLGRVTPSDVSDASRL